MELLPLLAQAAPASPDFSSMVEPIQRALPFVAAYFGKWAIAVSVLNVLAWWIVSNLISRESGSFLNALKLWGVYLLGGLLLAVLMVFIYMAAAASSAGMSAVGVIALLLMLALMLGGPMLVYSIGVVRSVLFVILSLVITAAGQLALGAFIPPPRELQDVQAVSQKISALTPAQRQQFIEAMSQSAAKGSVPASPEAIAADRSKSVEERHEALKKMYAQLDQQRLALKWGDQAALESYNRANARYQELLKQVQTEAARPAP